MTLGQVLEYESIQKGHLSEMERGIKAPTAAVIARLARRYKTSTDYLLGLTDDPAPRENAGETTLTPEQQQLLQETLDELNALSPRDQRTVLEIMRSMRKIEEAESEAVVPHIIGSE